VRPENNTGSFILGWPKDKTLSLLLDDTSSNLKEKLAPSSL